MKTVKLLVLMSFFSFYNVAHSAEPFSVICTVGYLGATALDSLSSLVPEVGYTLYGAHSVPLTSEIVLRRMLDRLSVRHKINLQQPTHIKESYSIWTAIAGKIFSNQNTLFVSKDVANSIVQYINENKNIDAMFAHLSEQEKKELITSSLMMAANYDNKVLALSLVTPLTVWILSYAVNSVTKKIKDYFPLEPTTLLVHKISKQFHKSFKIKAFVSALIVGAYIACQRYAFALQAQNFM